MAETTLITPVLLAPPKGQRVAARLMLIGLLVMVGAAWAVGLTLLT